MQKSINQPQNLTQSEVMLEGNDLNTSMTTLNKSILGDEEVKKLKDLMINSVRMNEKLNSDLKKAEFEVKNERQMMTSKMGSMLRDAEDYYKQTQVLYEDTVRQNQKAKYLAEQFIKPLRDQLRSKVDQTTFTLKMKMMLAEYDNIGQNITYQKNHGKISIDVHSNAAFEFLKNQILPIITDLEIQTLNSSKLTEDNALEISELKVKDSELQTNIKDSHKMFSEQNSKFMKELLLRTDESIIEKKMKELKEHLVQDYINMLIKNINSNHKEHQEELQKLRNHIENMSNISPATLQRISQTNKQIQDIKSDLMTFKTQTNLEVGKVIQKNQENQHHIEDMIKKDERIVKIKEDIKNLSKAVTESAAKIKQDVTKDVGKTVIGKVNLIEKETHNIILQCKKIETKVTLQNAEITSIKDLLSKKANFSDILVHIESKADKQDFQELKNLLENNNNHQYLSQEEELKDQYQKQHNQSDDNKYLDSNLAMTNLLRKKKRSSHQQISHKQHRSVIVSQCSSPVPDPENQHVKKFMLGYTQQFKSQDKSDHLKIYADKLQKKFYLRNIKKIEDFRLTS